MGRVKRKIGKVVAVIIFLAGSFTLGNEAGKLAIEREKSAFEVVRQAPAEIEYYNTGPEVIWDGKGGLNPQGSNFNFVGPGEVVPVV